MKKSQHQAQIHSRTAVPKWSDQGGLVISAITWYITPPLVRGTSIKGTQASKIWKKFGVLLNGDPKECTCGSNMSTQYQSEHRQKLVLGVGGCWLPQTS